MEQDFNGTLLKETKRHCDALFYAWSFGEIYFRNQGDDYITEQGTLTFVEYNNECYAITNQHVIGENWQERIEKESLMLALDTHKFWGISPIFISPPKDKINIFYPAHFPRDIAIFPFSNTRNKLTNANKTPILLRDNIPEIKPDEIVLVVGFPGGERENISETTCGHRLAHVFGTVRSVTETSIIIQDNNPTRDKDISFGGMSGGPIFKINENDGSYQFVGISYEGKGFKRKNEHNEEEIGDDIWVYGFPLCGRLLEEMISKN